MYYCSPLISQGVTTWGAFFGEHHPRNHCTLPRTWKPVYSAAHRILNTATSPEIFDVLDTWALCWGKGFFLKFVSPDPDTPKQKPNWVWEEWVKAKLHPTTKEFVQRAVWHKLMVHDCIFTLTGTTNCPLCRKKKAVRHALSECKIYPLIFDFLNKSLVVPRLNFCLRLQCLGSFPVLSFPVLSQVLCSFLVLCLCKLGAPPSPWDQWTTRMIIAQVP